MTISNIKNYFLEYLRYGAINPVRDWLVLITLSIIALAGIIVWNVWAFGTVVQGGVIGPSTTNSAPAFDRSSLDTINTIFSNRAIEEEKYVNDTYHYADPSQ
jgi:hypothetical protein